MQQQQQRQPHRLQGTEDCNVQIKRSHHDTEYEPAAQKQKKCRIVRACVLVPATSVSRVDDAWQGARKGPLVEELGDFEVALCAWKQREEQLYPHPFQLWELQDEVTPDMRCTLIRWLLDICREHRMARETFFLSINYLDRFLAQQRVSRAQFQLLGVTCLWIAAKYEEVRPPSARHLAAMTSNLYCALQLCQMELKVLAALDFELGTPTAFKFLDCFATLVACEGNGNAGCTAADPVAGNSSSIWQSIKMLAIHLLEVLSLNIHFSCSTPQPQPACKAPVSSAPTEPARPALNRIPSGCSDTLPLSGITSELTSSCNSPAMLTPDMSESPCPTLSSSSLSLTPCADLAPPLPAHKVPLSSCSPDLDSQLDSTPSFPSRAASRSEKLTESGPAFEPGLPTEVQQFLGTGGSMHYAASHVAAACLLSSHMLHGQSASESASWLAVLSNSSGHKSAQLLGLAQILRKLCAPEKVRDRSAAEA